MVRSLSNPLAADVSGAWFETSEGTRGAHFFLEQNSLFFGKKHKKTADRGPIGKV